jgi:hypothetical protein
LQREVETYSEIREERDEEPFTGKAIDPNDPPRYESQAEYLKRHNLFELGESRRLQAKSFEPEVVDFEECEEPESAGTVQ